MLAPHPPHLLPRRMSTLFPEASSKWLPDSPLGGLYSQKRQAQVTPHQELGLNWAQPKGLWITSLVCLVWFPLLKKRPFCLFSLPLNHNFPSIRRLWHARHVMLYTLPESHHHSIMSSRTAVSCGRRKIPKLSGAPFLYQQEGDGDNDNDDHGDDGVMCFLRTLCWASLLAQMVKNLPAMQETWVWSLGWEDPLEEEVATHSSIFAWDIP